MEDTIFSIWWWLDAISIALVILYHLVLLIFVAQIGSQTQESAKQSVQAANLLREVVEQTKRIASKGVHFR